MKFNVTKRRFVVWRVLCTEYALACHKHCLKTCGGPKTLSHSTILMKCSVETMSGVLGALHPAQRSFLTLLSTCKKCFLIALIIVIYYSLSLGVLCIILFLSLCQSGGEALRAFTSVSVDQIAAFTDKFGELVCVCCICLRRVG